MTDKPQVGKYLYKQVLTRGRNATNDARKALKMIVNNQPGPQTMSMLITQLAISVGEIEAVLNELDEIGRETRTRTKKTDVDNG